MSALYEIIKNILNLQPETTDPAFLPFSGFQRSKTVHAALHQSGNMNIHAQKSARLETAPAFSFQKNQ